MEIVVNRTTRTSKSTIGMLTIMGVLFRCFTLEDQDRGLQKNMPLDEIKKAKVFGCTAIPAGRYQVIITMSTRFKKEMPELVGVPGFGGIRIHSGNTAENTEGCILVGQAAAVNIVTSSRLAYGELFPIIQGAINKGDKVFITIV